MRRLPMAILLAASTVLAGCLQTATVEPAGDVDATALLARPWLGNWHTTHVNTTMDYDPAARMAKVETTLEIVNPLGVDRPWLWLLLEGLEITRLEDGEGRALEYTVSAPVGGTIGDMIPQEALKATFPLTEVNVTLQGDVSHGARQTIHMAYEGWYDSFSGPTFNAATDVPFALPNELGQNLHVALVPLVSNDPTTEQRLTVRSPSDWVTLAGAGLVSWLDDGTTVTAEYAGRLAVVPIYSATGIEWHEDNVNGINVRTYFYPDERIQGQVVHDVTRRILVAMPEYTGPYPYDHIWTVPHAIVMNAFSMQGLTFMGTNFYRFHIPNAPYQFGRFMPYPGGKDGFEMVIVHEHVHNWWGWNVEGNNSNPEAGPIDRWLSEGITTYLSETTWYQDQYGEEGASWSARSKIIDQYQNQALGVRRGRAPGGEEPGATEPGGDFYERTGLALRSLEAYAKASGRPAAMYDALKLIQAQYGLVQGGPGVVNSVEAFAIFEQVFQEDLDWFWNQHFLDSNLPDLTITGVAADATNVTVEVATGGDPAGVMVKLTTLTGRELFGIGVVTGTGTVSVARPPAAAMEPIVRAEVDPLVYVYESNEANNVWVGRA